MEKTQIRPNQSSFPSYDVHFRLKNLQIAVMNFENFLTIDDLVSYCRQLTSERIVVQHHGVKRVAFAEFREAEILCIKNRDTQNIVWPPNKNSNKLPLPHKPLPIPSPSFKSIGAALTNEVFADKLQGIEIPEQPPKKPLGGPVYVPPSKRIVVPPTPVPAPIITAPSVTTLQKNIPTSDRLIEIPKSTLPSRPKPILEIREEDFFLL